MYIGIKVLNLSHCHTLKYSVLKITNGNVLSMLQQYNTTI